jgi:YjjG family noncanonical pyrimidine nucleotidase
VYKAILFDFDGTLIDFDACEVHALREAFRDAGFEVDDTATWSSIWEAYGPVSASYWSRRTQEDWSRAQVIEYTMRATLVALGKDRSLAPALAASYWDTFCRNAYLNPGAREALERLSPLFKLGLVTNGDSDAQRGRLQAVGLAPIFQSVVISDEAGYAKPAREIFDLALSELGIKAQEALYVGDSIEHDYQGSRNAGIDFCYYQPDEQKKPAIRSRYRVRDLRELIHVLGLT